MLRGVKNGLGDDGFPLWDEWSQRDDSYNERDARDVWHSISPNGRVTVGTLIHEAMRHGYKGNGFAVLSQSSPEKVAERQRAIQADKQRETQQREAAAATAAAVLKAVLPARADHPYLARKRIPPVVTLHELPAVEIERLIGYAPTQSDKPLVGRVLIAAIRVGDALSSLEFIDESGRKSALAGGGKSGGFWSAQKMPDGDGEGLTLLLGEGVVTTMSATVATAHPAFAALSCGNLTKAAKALRARYSKGQLIILADIGNGERDAHAAAREVGALVAVPDFGEDRPEGASDFNDLWCHVGAEAVKRAIANAHAPDISLKITPNRRRAQRPILARVC